MNPALCMMCIQMISQKKNGSKLKINAVGRVAREKTLQSKVKNTRRSHFRFILEEVDRKWGFWLIDLGNFRKLGQDFLYLF